MEQLEIAAAAFSAGRETGGYLSVFAIRPSLPLSLRDPRGRVLGCSERRGG